MASNIGNCHPYIAILFGLLLLVVNFLLSSSLLSCEQLLGIVIYPLILSATASFSACLTGKVIIIIIMMMMMNRTKVNFLESELLWSGVYFHFNKLSDAKVLRVSESF